MIDSRTRKAAWLLAGAAGLAAAGCAAAQSCSTPYAASPQFSVEKCVFRNPENPDARPSQPAWKIWSRFLTPAPPGTVPVDPIPVRPLTPAMLAALDPTANHLVRLGHSSFLLKLRGKYWLIDPVFGERLGGFDIALMENGAYDSYWPSVHMTPEETVQAFKDVRGRLLYLVHNTTFDLAFHTWQDPLARVAALTEAKGLALATPEIGEVLTLGKPRKNVLWWKGLK